MLPQKPSHPTINRTSEVSEIMSRIQQLKAMFPYEITVTYLSGNPGCGKSELARQIGKNHFEDVHESAKCVSTLNASNLDSLTLSYIDLARNLRCSEESIASLNTITSQEQKLAQLRGNVSIQLHSYSSWLMIVDNVEDLRLVSRFLPHAGENLQHGKGHILITTQDGHSIPQSDPHTHHMPLSLGMELEDAVESLREISGCSDQEETMNAVAKQLDFQPLALACAAVYVQEVRIADPTMTWEKYLHHIQKNNIESTERMYEEINNSYKKSMTTAVKMAVQNIIEKSPVMLHAFEFLAALAPEFVSLHHVVNYVMTCLPEENGKYIAATIMKSSFVLTSEDKVEPIVRVHQVVFNVLQSVVQELHIDEEDEWSYLTKVIEVFSYLNEMDNSSIDFIRSTGNLVVHVANLSYKIKSFFEKHEILISTEQDKYGIRYYLNRNTTSQYSPEEIFLSKSLYGVLRAHGKHDICRILLEMGIILMTQTENRNKHIKWCNWVRRSFRQKKSLELKNHSSVAKTLNELGVAMNRLGNNKEAKECHEKALAIYKSTYGDNHHSVATSLTNLGLALSDLGNYKEAKEYHEKALAIDKLTHGDNHPEVAADLSNLGLSLCNLGNYKEAKDCHEKALDINKSTYGENHPHVATGFNNLGLALSNLGSYKQAKEYHEKALAIYKNTYGDNHPSVATSLNHLGSALSDLGNYNEEKALAIDKLTYGDNHPEVATDLSNLGSALSDLGNYNEAKECHKKALAIRKSTYGVNHPDVATSLNDLGSALSNLGSYKQAKECHEKALVIRKSMYGENHPSVATSLSNIGSALSNLASYKHAKECHEKALAISESTYGNHHCYVAIKLGHLGLVLRDIGEYKESKECIERAIAIDKTVLDETHPYIGIFFYKLGLTLHALGFNEEAKDSFERSLTILEAAYGEDHPRVARTLNGLGQLQMEQGDNELAKLNLERALAINEKSLGALHPDFAENLNNLGRLSESRNEYEQARAYFERALEINEKALGGSHPKVAITLKNLGHLLVKMKKDEEGRHCLERALAIKEKNPDYAFKFQMTYFK
ncbi:uncharacterized protein LOC110234664 [Exaiptasia diaphana]|uniref:NB-ARC domain-containing protein n=1 Tax=Exaiptasia diaphana TaxID=2652724 RepID=A0A913YDY4_EXADI|nr:uncharacterized protein LOC110234664 [Exaiptasia diaphana]